VEVDGDFEVFWVTEAGDAAFDRHELAVESFADGVGQAVVGVGDDVVESSPSAAPSRCGGAVR